MIEIRRLEHTCLCGGLESGLNAYVMNMAQGPGLTILCKIACERENLNSSLQGEGDEEKKW